MIKTFKFLFSRKPVYLVFHVTGNCNLKCGHCFNTDCMEEVSDDLSLDEIKKISGNMSHVKYLTMAGGEPFLRDDLDQIAMAFYKNNDLHFLNIVTNGWYSERTVSFVKSVFNNCPGLHISIGVSIDGPLSIHDRIRGKKGSFKRAEETVKRLKALTRDFAPAARGLTIAGCGTYNSLNSEVLAETALSLRNNFSIPYFAGLIRGDSMREPELADIDIEHYMSLLEKLGYGEYGKLAGNYPFRHIRLAVDQTVSDIIYESRRNKRMAVRCMAGKKGFVLSASGDLMLCEVLWKSAGNLRDNGYSPERILKSDHALKMIQNIREDKCHCTWECFQRLNVVFSPLKYPEVGFKAMRNFIGALK